MDKSTDDDETVKLLDVKDIEFIEVSELNEMNENDKNAQNTESMKSVGELNGVAHPNHLETDVKLNGNVVVCTERRSDEPTELSFEKGNFGSATHSDSVIKIFYLHFICKCHLNKILFLNSDVQ